jgi:hypothetical protein
MVPDTAIQSKRERWGPFCDAKPGRRRAGLCIVVITVGKRDLVAFCPATGVGAGVGRVYELVTVNQFAGSLFAGGSMAKRWKSMDRPHGRRRTQRQPRALERERGRVLRIEQLETRLVMDAAPLISEFLASNDGGLQDVDGDSGDWIELYNPSATPVNLAGWTLTDDPNDLNQWLFPSVTIGGNDFLTVFASGKNRAVAGAELHTSFKLSEDGEYLALVRPDGTIAQEFAPSYPEQATNISYGTVFDTEQLIAAGDTAQYLVPTSDALGTSWTSASFAPSGWSSGPTGLGYGVVQAGFLVTYIQANTYVDNLDVCRSVIADTSLRRATVQTTAPVINYLGTGGSANFGDDLAFPTQQIGQDYDDFVVRATAQIIIPSTGLWSFGVNSDDGFELTLQRGGVVLHTEYFDPRGPADTITVFDVPIAGAWQATLAMYERGGGAEVELFAAQGDHPNFADGDFALVGDRDNGGLTAYTAVADRVASEHYVARFTADSLNTLLTNDAVVASWMDTDPNGNGKLRASATGDPRLNKNALNGHSVVRFDTSRNAALDQFRLYGSNTNQNALNPLAGAGDFSVAVVFRTTTAGAGGAGQWWENSGLVDAEESGALDDWGLAFNGAGQVGAGLGNPDVSVYSDSSTNFADGAGHVALMVRSGGAISLYVDGRLQSDRSDGGQAGRSVADLVFGSLQTNVNGFTGDLAEIQLYNVALTSSQVARIASDLATVYGIQDVPTPVVGVDLTDKMHGINSSVYVRVPFTMTDASAYESMTLTMRYDDGFVAYLNGVEVARRNAPGALGYHASATSDRDDLLTPVPETIQLSSYVGLLQDGLNVLAIQGLNASPTDGCFLVLPELLAASVRADELRYFAEPTPGAANATPSLGIVGRAAADVDGGFFMESFSVALESPTPGAVIRYTLDGSTPTASHGEIYSAPLYITGTTSLRASAFMTDYITLPSITRTYVFPADVVDQSGDGSPPAGWPSYWGSNVVDYGMDPAVVYGTETPQSVIDALMALPSIAITTDLPNLFDPATGIYANAYYDGRDWERPAAVELLNPDGSPGFQVNAGLRIRGGYSRYGGNPKHAFRLFFRSEYGDSSLDFPLFGDEGVDSFKKLDLRTAQNYSWSFGGDPSNTFIEDVFARDTQRDMGQPYTRSRWYHLYINGQYWGLYQSQERPEAEYAASYFGGSPDDYDVIKPEAGPYIITATDGNLDAYHRLWEAAVAGFTDDAAYWRLQGKNPDGSENLSYEVLLDVDNLIVYMIDILYGGNLDAPISNFLGNDRPNNFFAVRDRTGREGFRYFAHDSEHTLHDVYADRNGPYPAGSLFEYFNPQWLHQQLMANAEYRLKFADTVQEAFAAGGALSVEQAQARWSSHMAQLDQAIAAESARWGDAQRPDSPLGHADWLAAATNTRDNFLPNRGAILLQQFHYYGLLPAIDAPQFLINGMPLDGGQILPGSTLRFGATGGVVFYTTDGTDPRLIGGGVNPSAQVYDPGTWTEVVVPTGAAWKYFDQGRTPATDWTSRTYSDAAWSSGAAELGYGDGDEVTIVGYGPDAGNKYPTTYFRHHFTMTTVDDLVGMTLQLKRDDGAVVYVNGVEAARSNMPTGDIAFETFSAGVVGGGDESTFYQLALNPSLLQVGDNVIAVEIHQCNSASSDVSFDAALTVSRQSNLGLTVDESTHYVARVRNAEGTWSAVNDAQFITAVPATADNLAVTEIMYHPPAASGSEPAIDKDEFEFIELQNISDEAINLSGVQFTNGVGFNFSDGNVLWLAAGQCVVVVRSPAAFQARYGTGVTVAGTYGTSLSNNLSNGGERITLTDAAGEIIQDFVYDDDPSTTPPWPQLADGRGYSLTIRRTNLDYALPGSWRASYVWSGTPGYEENDFPENLELSNQSVAEKMPNAKVGDLSADDPNTGDVVAFTLQPGADSALFTLVGHELRVGPVGLDHQQAAQRSVIVRATDLGGLYIERMFTIDVRDTTPPIVTVNHLETTNASPALHGTVDDHEAVISVTVAGHTYAAVNQGDGTWTLPQGTISPRLPVGTYDVAVTATDLAGNAGHDASSQELTIRVGVVGRYIFYNNSAWDGHDALKSGDPAANAFDDAAIAPDKQALRAGQKARFVNYTSYNRGINGIMIDIANLADPAGLSVTDFQFRTGNTSNPTNWTPLTMSPTRITVAVRPGAGIEGSDRVTILFLDETIKKTWLQVTVKVTPATGLAAPDVHYWGNAVGESGNSTTDATVTIADQLGARANPHSAKNPAPIDDRFDYNRDKRVTVGDQLIARANATTKLTDLELIDLRSFGAGEGEGNSSRDNDAWVSWDEMDFSDLAVSTDVMGPLATSAAPAISGSDLVEVPSQVSAAEEADLSEPALLSSGDNLLAPPATGSSGGAHAGSHPSSMSFPVTAGTGAGTRWDSYRPVGRVDDAQTRPAPVRWAEGQRARNQRHNLDEALRQLLEDWEQR